MPQTISISQNLTSTLRKCIFLGQSNNHKGYHCLSPSGCIYTSRHVCFNEKEFSFDSGFLKQQSNIDSSSMPILSWLPIHPQSNTTHSPIANSHTLLPTPSTDPSNRSATSFPPLSLSDGLSHLSPERSTPTPVAFPTVDPPTSITSTHPMVT